MEKRLIPVNIFDTVAMEQWLSQMADEGLILDSFTGKKAKFKDECCQKLKYRLILKEVEDEVVPSTVIEPFEEKGWNFVAVLQKTFYVFSNSDEYPNPIPYSKEEERRLYEELEKKKHNSMWLAGAGVIFFLGAQLAILYMSFDDYILGSEEYRGYAFIIAMIIYTMQSIREYRSYVLIKKKLEGMDSGVEEDSPYIPTTKWIRAETVLNFFAFAVLFIPIITEGVRLYNYDKVDSAKISVPFSYVTLEEIETEKPEMEYWNEGTYIDTRTSLLAPIQYEIEEYGRTNYVLNGKMQRGDAHIRLTYIELRYEALANGLLQKMMRLYHTTKFEEEDLDVDQVWIGESVGDTKIYLQKDNRILEVMYWGERDILSHLNEFSLMVQESHPAESV